MGNPLALADWVALRPEAVPDDVEGPFLVHLPSTRGGGYFFSSGVTQWGRFTSHGLIVQNRDSAICFHPAALGCAIF